MDKNDCYEALRDDPFWGPILKNYRTRHHSDEVESVAELKAVLTYHTARNMQLNDGDLHEFTDRLIDLYAVGCDDAGREFVRGYFTGTLGDPVPLGNAIEAIEEYLNPKLVH